MSDQRGPWFLIGLGLGLLASLSWALLMGQCGG